MFKPTGVLRGLNDMSPRVIIDDLYDQAINPNFEEIQKLKNNIFKCRAAIYKFEQYVQFKSPKSNFNKLIALNLGQIKECQIRIALLGG